MSVLVDTSVWSLALRRRAPAAAHANVVTELAALVRDGRAAIIGPIRQELLTGVRSEPQFVRLQEQLAAFPDIALESADYVTAARFSNRCRGKGIQGSAIDLLICAVAASRELPIFTTDGDFEHYRRALDIDLHPMPR